jgi:DNA-directed RNA polymerase subunit beta
MPNLPRRKTYARIPDVLPLPNLIQVQLESYDWFKQEGLQELFDEISPIESFSGNLELHLPGLNKEINEKLGLDYRFEEPKYSQ